MKNKRNIIIFQKEKQSTPDDLLTTLEKNYREDRRRYMLYLLPILSLATLSFLFSLYVTVAQDKTIAEFISMIVPAIFGTAILYILIRLKFRPTKPKMDDAMVWRKTRDKQIYGKK